MNARTSFYTTLLAIGSLTASCNHKHQLSAICTDAHYTVSFNNNVKEVPAPYAVLGTTDTMIMSPYYQRTSAKELAHLSYERHYDSSNAFDARKIILTNGKEMYTGFDPDTKIADSTDPDRFPHQSLDFKLMTPKEYKKFLKDFFASQNLTLTDISPYFHGGDVHQLNKDAPGIK